MANLKPSRGDRSTAPPSDESGRSDRAQLLLITGLVLAVVLVTVVLLLNAVIYTENLATRGVDAGGTEAAEFREGTATDVGAIMDRMNRNEGSSASELNAEIETYATRIREHRLQDGVVSDVTLHEGTAVNGWYIAQDRDDDTYREFTSKDDAANWMLVENATTTRGYRFTVDAAELKETEAHEDEAFAVHVDDAESTASWTLYIYKEPDEQNVTLTADGGSEEFSPVSDQDGNDVLHVDLTDGTVNGEPWSPLVWAEGVEGSTDRYHVSYEHGDQARGTYEQTVEDGGETDVFGDGDRFESTATDSSPYALDAVYSVEVTVGSHTPELRYEDRVRVAPGERDD